MADEITYSYGDRVICPAAPQLGVLTIVREVEDWLNPGTLYIAAFNSSTQDAAPGSPRGGLWLRGGPYALAEDPTEEQRDAMTGIAYISSIVVHPDSIEPYGG